MSNEIWIAEMTESDCEVWSVDIEGESREQVIADGMKYAKKEGLKSFRIGQREDCGVPQIYSDTVMENAIEQLHDEVGEVAETYLEDVTKEQSEELEEMLNNVFYEWHKKHKLFPSCFMVINEEVIEVNKDMDI